jgi:hypothetical protein
MPRDSQPHDSSDDLDAFATGDDLDPSLDLDAREAARARRRDHEADAARRELLRPGMGKVFKQIQDSWGEKAARDERHGRRSRPRDD